MAFEGWAAEGSGVSAAVDFCTAHQAVQSRAKRAMDVAVALALLIFLTPLLLVAMAAIVSETRGPVLFRQRRGGLDHQPFEILKFRSMKVLEDGEIVLHATRRDARVTRVGRYLRRTSIDELPQLLNVLKGDMSLVGPRPHALAHDQLYGEKIPHYRQRFRVRPGLTGLAQVSGHRGEITCLQDMEARVSCDLAYADRWDVWLDLKILVKTAVVVLADRKAY